jgi:hypothetical protein
MMKGKQIIYLFIYLFTRCLDSQLANYYTSMNVTINSNQIATVCEISDDLGILSSVIVAVSLGV